MICFYYSCALPFSTVRFYTFPMLISSFPINSYAWLNDSIATLCSFAASQSFSNALPIFSYAALVFAGLFLSSSFPCIPGISLALLGCADPLLFCTIIACHRFSVPQLVFSSLIHLLRDAVPPHFSPCSSVAFLGCSTHIPCTPARCFASANLRLSTPMLFLAKLSLCHSARNLAFAIPGISSHFRCAAIYTAPFPSLSIPVPFNAKQCRLLLLTCPVYSKANLRLALPLPLITFPGPVPASLRHALASLLLAFPSNAIP